MPSAAKTHQSSLGNADRSRCQHSRPLLFAAKSENPIGVGNYERLLRSFFDDNSEALEKLGVGVWKAGR